MRGKHKHHIYILILNIVLIICIILIITHVYTTLEKESFQDTLSLIHTIDSKIKVFTYATEMKETLKYLLSSLRQNNYSYEVVGYGEPWGGFRNRVNVYLSAVKRYKEEKGGDAIVVMLDGYDCLSVRDSSSMYDSFVQRPRNHIPVLFGVEVACMGNCYGDILEWYTYHNIYGGETEIKNSLRDIGNGTIISDKPVFLNGGMLMGSASAIEELYTGMLALNIEDDQISAGRYTVDNLDKVDLDVEEMIFRNKLLERRIKLDDENNGAGPAFLHFPGYGNIESIIELMKSYSPR